MSRRKKSVPSMLFWNKRDQSRFIETVEKLSSHVNDIEKLLEPAKRRRAVKSPPSPASAQLDPSALSLLEEVDARLMSIFSEDPGMRPADETFKAIKSARGILFRAIKQLKGGAA